jgi:hypothetical protein
MQNLTLGYIVFSDVDRDGKVFRYCLKSLFFHGAEVIGLDIGGWAVALVSQLKDAIELLVDDLREFEGIQASTQLLSFLQAWRDLLSWKPVSGREGWCACHRFFSVWSLGEATFYGEGAQGHSPPNCRSPKIDSTAGSIKTSIEKGCAHGRWRARKTHPLCFFSTYSVG